MMKILRNSAKCRKCGAEIESTYRHDFKFHECGPGSYFAVDGGKEYIRRVGQPANYVDTSIYEHETPITATPAATGVSDAKVSDRAADHDSAPKTGVGKSRR